MNGVRYYYTEAEGIEVVLTKGQSHCYPWHMHTRHWTIGIIRQGAISLTTMKGCQHLCQGQSFSIPPFEVHSLHVEPESSLLVMCVAEQGALLLSKSPESILRHFVCMEPAEAEGITEALMSCKHHGFPYVFSEKYLPILGSSLEWSLREVMRLMLATPDEPLRIDQMAAYAGYKPVVFFASLSESYRHDPSCFSASLPSTSVALSVTGGYDSFNCRRIRRIC